MIKIVLLEKIIKVTNWKVCTCNHKCKHVLVDGGYCSDLLSDVIENADSNSIWITIQSHENIIAVALLCEINAILISGSRKISPETLERAEKENIIVLSSQENTYKCACKLFSILQK